MSQVWSEINKIVNAVPPHADAWSGDVQSDIVHLENFKKCTFLIMTGASANNVNTVTVQAGADNAATGVVTDIPFKYRSTTATDIYGALTASTGGSFAFTASQADQFHIVEVDASVVAAAGTDFDHCAISVAEAGSCGAQLACVVAVLSEPRYPQAVLQTAID